MFTIDEDEIREFRLQDEIDRRVGITTPLMCIGCHHSILSDDSFHDPVAEKRFESISADCSIGGMPGERCPLREGTYVD